MTPIYQFGLDEQSLSEVKMSRLLNFLWAVGWSGSRSSACLTSDLLLDKSLMLKPAPDVRAVVSSWARSTEFQNEHSRHPLPATGLGFTSVGAVLADSKFVYLREGEDKASEIKGECPRTPADPGQLSTSLAIRAQRYLRGIGIKVFS